MKKQIILWLATLLITLMFSVISRKTSDEYPVTGTLNYNGEKVSYLFDKVYRSDVDYKFQIFTKIKNLKGNLQFKINKEDDWKNIPLVKDGKIYYAIIPHQKPLATIIYRAELEYKNNNVIIPKTNGITLTFLGKVSSPIMYFYYLSIFFALFLTTRIGLEYFNDNEKIKKLSLFPVILFLFYSLLIVPIKRTYELAAFNNSIPAFDKIFELKALAFFIIWLVATIVIFNSKQRKLIALVTSIILLLLYVIS